MTRKRAPPKRPGTLSNGARTHNGHSGSVDSNPKTTGNRSALGGGSEVGGLVRAVLLGIVVSAVVGFLFYPDISRVLSNLNGDPSSASSSPSSPPSSSQEPPAQSQASQKAQVDTAANSRLKEAEKDAQDRLEDVEQIKRSPASTSSSSPSKDNPASPGCDEDLHGRSNSRFRPRSANDRTQEKKSKSRPPQDLMVFEQDGEGEIIEEEDPAELELMEEEETVQYIELKGEEDDEEEEEEEHIEDRSYKETRKASNEEKSQKMKLSKRSAQTDEEDIKDKPVPVIDGQTITFTPLSPGDENVIRLGGRPKPNQDKIKLRKPNAEPPKTSDSSSRKTANSEAKFDNAEKAKPGKPTVVSQDGSSGKGDKKTNKPKTSSSSSSSKKSSSSKSGSTKSVADDNEDLPEEVRNFKPTYLKTVTAKKIFADGRRIPPIELLPEKQTNSSVKVYLFNEFLSDEECDGLRRVHDKHVQDMSTQPLLCFSSFHTLRQHLDDVKSTLKVTPNDFIAGTRCVNASLSKQLGQAMSGNWSYSTAFYPGESRFSDIFSSRVQQAMGLDPRNGGKFQITSYPTGKAYKAHTDCVLDGTDQRDRVATVLVYLDDVEDGGETKFPELGIWVKPRKGRALVWNNMSPEGVCEPHSLHVATKVNRGSKYILIRWYYYKSFFSLGKRPPEPTVPVRAAGTPRVSCDDYDNGSCRWYDEWNMDHLTEYEANKYSLI